MVIRWEPAGKLASVSVFELDGKVDYAYVSKRSIGHHFPPDS